MAVFLLLIAIINMRITINEDDIDYDEYTCKKLKSLIDSEFDSAYLKSEEFQYGARFMNKNFGCVN